MALWTEAALMKRIRSTTSYVLRARVLTAFLSIGILLTLLPACGQKEAPKPAVEEETDAKKKFTPPPELNDEGDEEEGFLAATRMVNEEAAKSRKPTYIPDDAYPSGHLRGICHIKYEKRVGVPYPYPMTHLPEPYALPLKISNAVNGELDYYRRNAPVFYFGVSMPMLRQRGKYAVGLAAVMLEKVPVGRKMPLNPLQLQVSQRTKLIEEKSRAGGKTVCAAPVNTRIIFTNEDFYDCELEIAFKGADGTSQAKPVKIVKLAKYHDPKHPGFYFGQKFGMAQPPMVQSPVLREPGLYTVQCKRHLWQRTYVWVVENPYICITQLSGRGWKQGGMTGGPFTMKDVPTGKYTVRAWHPSIKPLKSSFEIEITQNEYTDLPIEFEVSRFLKEPVAQPSTPVKHWAFIGPFEADNSLVLPPEKQIDLKASYEGLNEEKIAWRMIKLKEKQGSIPVKEILGTKIRGSLNFAYTVLESPKDQKIMLKAWANRLKTLWLNGTKLKASYHGGWHSFYGGYLKKGKNGLLVKFSACTNREFSAHLGVAYKADGVKVVELGK